MAEITYPLDPTGNLQTNKIINEPHTLTTVNATTYRLVIPKVAPFHKDNFKIVYVDLLGQETLLVKDVDYQLCLPYLGASRSIGKMIYGGASINREDLNGSLKVTYQTLGGEWTTDAELVLERVTEMSFNPRIAIWDIITNKPNQFPPINHDQNFDYVFGQGELISKLDELKDAVLNGPNAANVMMRHIFFESNPHNIDKNVVGLSNVENLALATDNEVLARALEDKYVTLRQIVTYLAGSGGTITPGNPVTPPPSGLDESIIATLEEVMNKEDVHKHVTLDTLVSAGFLFTLREVLANIDKGSIGLNNVANIGIASDQEVLDKEPVERYVTLRQMLELGLISTIPTSEGTVNTPSIIQPLVDAVVNRTFTVSGSDFLSSYDNDQHIETQVRVSEYVTMDNSSLFTKETDTLTHVLIENLEPLKEYYLDIRYRSLLGGWTSYSTPIKVTTVGAALMLENAKLKPYPELTSELFADVVVISDDGLTAVACDYMDHENGSRTGAVHVYVKENGFWVHQFKIVSSSMTEQALFGFSASISGQSQDGQIIVVGAKASRKAYVFSRTNNTWTQTATLVSGETNTDVDFGHAVKISKDGSVIAVGAPKATTHSTNVGAVYLFEKVSVNWYMSKKLAGDDSLQNDYFGGAVDIADNNNRVIVGAHLHDDFQAKAVGAVYVFDRSGPTWIQTSKVMQNIKVAGSHFGKSVSIIATGTIMAIGADHYDEVRPKAGAVYVFTIGSGVWNQTALIKPNEATTSLFGCSIKLSENASVLIVGAKESNNFEGRVFVYTKVGNNFNLRNTVIPSDGFNGQQFGTSVDMSRDSLNVVVGAPGINFNTDPFGSAYIFTVN